MKDFKLNKNQLRDIKNKLEWSDVATFLREYQNMKFAVGDIVVKKYRQYDEDDNVTMVCETVSYSNKTPRKYMCIHEDEFGVPVFAPIKANGELSEQLVFLYDFDLSSTKFVLDDTYAMHKILAEEGEEFDPLDSYKAAKAFRAKALKENRKLLVNIHDGTYEERVKFIDSLNVGQELWISDYLTGLCSVNSKYTVKKIKSYTYTQAKKESNKLDGPSWLFDSWIEEAMHDKDKRKGGFKIVELENKTGDCEEITYVRLNRCITLSPPFPLEEGKQ